MLQKALAIPGKIIRAILLFITAVVPLVIGYRTWFATTTGAAGRQWCDNIMARYQSDPEGTVASYRSMQVGDDLWQEADTTADNNLATARPRFEIDPEGNFTCAYNQVGGLFPQLHEYSSLTGEWVIHDQGRLIDDIATLRIRRVRKPVFQRPGHGTLAFAGGREESPGRTDCTGPNPGATSPLHRKSGIRRN